MVKITIEFMDADETHYKVEFLTATIEMEYNRFGRLGKSLDEEFEKELGYTVRDLLGEVELERIKDILMRIETDYSIPEIREAAEKLTTYEEKIAAEASKK